VLFRIIAEYHLDRMMGEIIGKDSGLFLDLALYSIITENNAGQYYSDYAYSHPLLTDGMRICSDSKVSVFINGIKKDQSIEFLKRWNSERDHRERIYVSYDSTNKNCQAGDVEIAEFGHAKFVLVTSEKMTAADALATYKIRDGSEKLFSGDKSYLGDRSYGVHSTESVENKIFIEFVALVIRNRFFTYLKDYIRKSEKKENFLTVPAAIRELEKIEMVRLSDGNYRMDHAVTKRQKEILQAFGMTERNIREQAVRIDEMLQGVKEGQGMARRSISLEEKIEKQKAVVMAAKEKYETERKTAEAAVETTGAAEQRTGKSI